MTISLIKLKIKEFIRYIIRPYLKAKYGKKSKIFCIGKNKTGTTSMSVFLNGLGYEVAPQWPAELLMKDWGKRKFKRIIDFVSVGGVAFQDVPFSLPDTYKIMDKAFPESKFILTIRDSAEVWYNSLTTFNAKLFGIYSNPSKEMLQNVDYLYKGYVWECNRMIYATPENDPYNKEILIAEYKKYTEDVCDYFKHRPEQLLVINLKEPDANKKIADFLNYEGDLKAIPWVNRS